MTVTMTVAETLTLALAGTDYSDALADGSGGTTNSGMDYGQVVNGKYAPLIDEIANTGRLDIYYSHDATVDPVTDVKFFLDEFSGANGYGGPGSRSPTIDLTTILDEGNTSANVGSPPSKNNANGLGAGIWIDQDADVSDTNQFDWSTNRGNGTPAGNGTVYIYGANGGAATGEGRDLATAFGLMTDAMVHDVASVETLATSPVAGQIGRRKAVDATEGAALGEAAHIRTRVYIRTAFTEGGIFQFDNTIAFSFTA